MYETHSKHNLSIFFCVPHMAKISHNLTIANVPGEPAVLTQDFAHQGGLPCSCLHSFHVGGGLVLVKRDLLSGWGAFVKGR